MWLTEPREITFTNYKPPEFPVKKRIKKNSHPQKTKTNSKPNPKSDHSILELHAVEGIITNHRFLHCKPPSPGWLF